MQCQLHHHVCQLRATNMAVSSAAATKLCAASFLLGVACGFAMNKYARKVRWKRTTCFEAHLGRG